MMIPSYVAANIMVVPIADDTMPEDVVVWANEIRHLYSKIRLCLASKASSSTKYQWFLELGLVS